MPQGEYFFGEDDNIPGNTDVTSPTSHGISTCTSRRSAEALARSLQPVQPTPAETQPLLCSEDLTQRGCNRAGPLAPDNQERDLSDQPESKVALSDRWELLGMIRCESCLSMLAWYPSPQLP